MPAFDIEIVKALATALGVGLLVGAVRERRKADAVIVAGLTEADQRCGDPAVDASVVTDLSGPPPVHDERPFLYLKDASIPGTFLLVIVMVLLVSLIAVRVIGGPLRRMAPYADLACLGAAFLLLETRAVTWSCWSSSQ